MTHTNVMEPVDDATPTQPHWWTGYGQAIVHLAWLRDDRVRHLLFGMVELRPSEFPAADSSLELSHRAANKGRLYLYYRRFAMPVEEAVRWYEAAAHGNLALPRDYDRSNVGEMLHGGPFLAWPAWPNLATSNKLDFAPDWMHDSRAHFLDSRCSLSRTALELVRKPTNRAQLERWLHFDLVYLYQDYLGTLCLVAPNPLFRRIEKSHLEDRPNGSGETVAYKLIARSGQSLDGTRLEVTNEGPRGLLTPIPAEYSDDAIKVLEFPDQIDREGRSITHPHYGLLSRSEPVPIIRKIGLNLAVENRQKSITVPPDGKRPSYTYSVPEWYQESTITIGAEMDDSTIHSKLVEADHRRTRRQKGARQLWFHNRSANAAQCIRDIIGNARETLLIADPYFGGRELLAFGHAIQWPDVQLRVLTSASYFKKPKFDTGVELQRILNQTFQIYPTIPEVRLLLGEIPSLHDRFLVVDNNIWLSGNSLHTIGERASMIVQLPDPEPIVAYLDALWSGATLLGDWIKTQGGNHSPAA